LPTAFARYAYLPLTDAVKRMPVRRYLREAEALDRRPLRELEALQLDKLRRALEQAGRETRFYAERFRAAGFRPDELRSVTDLARIPELSKYDIFEHREEMRSPRCVGRRFDGFTSGSTGVALHFDFDSRQYGYAIACGLRGRGWWGVRRGDSELSVWGRPAAHTWWTDRSTWAKYKLRNTVQFDAFANFDGDAIIAALRRIRPRVVYGYGSSLGRLAEAMAARGVALEGDERPAIVEYTADHMYAQEKKLCEQVFGAPVLSAYGSSDCGGVAQQCREGRLHMSIDHVVVEFLRDDGSAAGPDETARVVLTQLHNAAMPLVRYAVGDLGSYSADPCPCGVTLPVMNLTIGKTADVINTSQRSGVQASILDYINILLMKEGIRGVKQYMVLQTSLDAFKVSFVKETPFEQRAVDVFVAKMREYLGDGIAVTVDFVDAIPLQKSGKRRYFLKAFGQEREASSIDDSPRGSLEETAARAPGAPGEG
jgi:phenylacetate-CoA ligase